MLKTQHVCSYTRPDIELTLCSSLPLGNLYHSGLFKRTFILIEHTQITLLLVFSGQSLLD